MPSIQYSLILVLAFTTQLSFSLKIPEDLSNLGTFNSTKSALDSLIPALTNHLFSESQSYASSLSAINRNDLDDPWYHLSCDICHATMNSLDSFLHASLFDELLDDAIIQVCSSSLNKTVCAGAIRKMTPFVIDSFLSGVFSADFVCNYVKMCNFPQFTYLNYQDYVDGMLKRNKPQSLNSNDFVDKLYDTIQEDDEVIKVLHITDPHVDFNYTVGTNAKCNEPLCCRPENGIALDSKSAAGKWGDYNCDPPIWLAQSVLSYIHKEVPDIAFAVWTGDNIQHNIWAQKTEDSIWNTAQLSELITRTFGQDFPVYPVLGNHEPIPVNVYDTESHTNKLNEGISKSWNRWLDDAALQSFIEHGYYQMKSIKGMEKIRYIGLNSQECNNQNFYFFKIHNDLGKHLEWLEGRLLEARKDGVGVWLASHIAPGQGVCFSEWSIRFRSLIDAFQDVIRVHLAGHSHSEFYQLVRDAQNQSKAINVVLGGGSITTYTDKNPNVQILEVHKKTGLVINSIAYAVNLAEANATPDQEPKWARKYDYKSDYSVKDLSPKSLDALVDLMKDNQEMAVKYLANSSLTYSSNLGSCGEGCRHTLYCRVRNSVSWEEDDCTGSPRIDFKNNFANSFLETTMSPWFQIKVTDDVITQQ